jgi:GNAT superfamily N-acetyltransferase
VTDTVIRRAAPDDVADILRLIRDLAAYEREPDAVEATVDMLAATLFGGGTHVHAHVAEQNGAIVGTAIWFLNYSTWTGRPGLYLEDLFVDEGARGGGVGRALLVALAREAVSRGCARMDWAVLDWNEDAMAVYRAIGARPSAGWQPWRLEGEALARLAA